MAGGACVAGYLYPADELVLDRSVCSIRESLCVFYCYLDFHILALNTTKLLTPTLTSSALFKISQRQNQIRSKGPYKLSIPKTLAFHIPLAMLIHTH